MAQIEIKKLFEYRNVTPSGLTQGNLIYFKYKSPNGVHDNAPLVYVVERRIDRLYGFNIHYEMNELQELVDNVKDKVDTFLENKWLSKHPDKRQELREDRAEFDQSMVDQKELIQFKRSFNKKDLEIYQLHNLSTDNLRCYLYKRMNNVSKLVWKL
jgi:hypothetical protein